MPDPVSPREGEAKSAKAKCQAPFTPNTSPFNFPVSAIGISPQNDNVRVVGLSSGAVFATNPMPNVTGPWGGHYVARAVVDPTNQTLTANVAQNSSGVPATGTMTFNDGTTALTVPPVTLDTNAAASFTTSFANGTHNITAAYSGDINYSGATSESVLLDVGPPDYALNLPTTSATINAQARPQPSASGSRRSMVSAAL